MPRRSPDRQPPHHPSQRTRAHAAVLAAPLRTLASTTTVAPDNAATIRLWSGSGTVPDAPRRILADQQSGAADGAAATNALPGTGRPLRRPAPRSSALRPPAPRGEQRHRSVGAPEMTVVIARQTGRKGSAATCSPYGAGAGPDNRSAISRPYRAASDRPPTAPAGSPFRFVAHRRPAEALNAGSATSHRRV